MSNWLMRCATPPAAGDRGGAGATETHTFPAAAASASGVPPRQMVLVALPGTWIEAHDRAVAAVRDPDGAVGMATIAVGPAPTCVVPVTASVSRSTWTTASSAASATHTPTASTAAEEGPWPTGIVVVSSVAGSIRVTVPSLLFVTHSDPSPTAIAVGSFPTSTDTVRRPEWGFTRETYPSGSVTQIESNAARVGLGVESA